MRAERKSWAIRQGDPAKPGTTRTADGYNFALQVKNDEPVELIFTERETGNRSRKL